MNPLPPAGAAAPVPPAPSRLRLPLAALIPAMRLLSRFPWLMPLVSFIGGWAGFALVKRGDDLAQWVAAFALLGWPWLLAEPLIVRWGARLIRRPVPPALICLVTQGLQQEMLFFALPFLAGAMQADAGQWIFTGIAVLAAVISTVDPVYARYIAARPWRSLLFHAYCSFIAGLVVLPIAAHLPIEKALPLAMALTGLWLLLSLPRMVGSLTTYRARMACFGALLGAPLLVWSWREHIPPAGLWVKDARITQRIEARVPGDEVRELDVDRLRAEGVIAFVAVRAPTGVAQRLIFEWAHEGRVVDRIPAEVQGTGSSGWRTYSRKRVFPDEPRGHWSVEVKTPFGQRLARLRFTVN